MRVCSAAIGGAAVIVAGLCRAQPLPPKQPAANPSPVPSFTVFIQQDPTGVQFWIEEAMNFEAAAREAAKAGRPNEAREIWQKAVRLLQDKILAKVTDRAGRPEQRNIVVYRPTPGASKGGAGTARFVPAARAVREMIAAWPKEGQEVYRSLYEDEAAALLKKKAATRRPEELLEVADLYGSTAAGLAALEMAADLMTDRGQFAEAAGCFRELIASPAEGGPDRGLLKAKLALCAAAAGRPGLAAPVLAADLADPAKAPVVTVRGKPTGLAEFAGPLLAAAEQAERARDGDRPWTGFGGSPAHDRPSSPVSLPLSKHWSLSAGPLAPDAIIPEPNHLSRRPTILHERVTHNPYMPAFSGNLMILQVDGPRQGEGVQSQLLLYDLAKRRQLAAEKLPPDRADFEGSFSTSARVPGSDRFVGIWRDRVFVRTGNPPQIVPNARGWGPATELPSTIALKAYDIVRPADGGLAKFKETDWQPRGRTAEDEDFLKEGYFLTAPVPGEGGRLYAGFARKKNESWMVCLDAADGKILWRTFVASGDTYKSGQMVSAQLEGSQPTVDGDTVYYCTNVGAVGALWAATGRVRWVSVYESSRPATGTLNPNSAYPWRNNPPIVHDGVVYAAPMDDKELVFLDAATGAGGRKTVVRLYQPRYLVGVAKTCDPQTGEMVPAIFVVGRKVVAFAVRNNKQLWTADFSDPERSDRDFIVGRPALTEDMLILPTRRGIVALDLKKQFIQPDAIPPADFEDFVHAETRRQLSVPVELPDDFPGKDAPGNLAVHEGRLVAVMEGRDGRIGEARPGSVYIAKGQNVMLEELSARETGDPKKLARLLKAGGDAMDAGKFADAAEPLAQAAELLIKLDPHDLRSLSMDKLAGRLLTLAEKEPKNALRLLDLSAALAPPGPVKALTLWRTAAALSAAGRDADAVDRLQSLTALFASSEWSGPTLAMAEAGVRIDLAALSRAEIRRLVAEKGVVVYEAFEREAAEKLAEARAKSDPMKYRELYQRYPAAAAARVALLELGRLRQKSKAYPGALEALRALRADWPGTVQCFQAAQSELEILEETKRWGEARELLRSLYTVYPKARLGEQTVEEIVRDRAARPEYAALKALTAGPARKAIVRIGDKPEWKAAVAAGKLLSPGGEAADDVVLVAGPDGVQALKPADGTPAWKAELPWSAGGTDHAGYPRNRIDSHVYDGRLFVGFPAALGVVELKSGKRLYAEAEGKGRAFHAAEGDVAPPGLTSQRVLRMWGVCDGYAFAPEAVAVQRFAAEGNDARFVIFRPAPGKGGDLRAGALPDANKMMGRPLIAAGAVFGLSRKFAVRGYDLFNGRPDSPELDVAGDAAPDGPPMASDDGEFLFLSAGGVVSAYSLRPAVWGPDTRIALLWQRSFGGRPAEPVACGPNRLVVLLPDGDCIGIDVRTARTVWTAKGVRSDKGPLLDAVPAADRKSVTLVFGDSHLRPEPARKAPGYEIVTIDTGDGSVLNRSGLSAPGAEADRPGVWMTPAVVGRQIVFASVMPAGKDRRQLRLWVVTPTAPGGPAAPEAVTAAFPLPGEAPDAAAVSRLTDNMFAIVGDRLLISDGESVAAYPLATK